MLTFLARLARSVGVIGLRAPGTASAGDAPIIGVENLCDLPLSNDEQGADRDLFEAFARVERNRPDHSRQEARP